MEKMDIKNQIGEEIRRARLAAGVSQEWLAKMVNKKQSQISSYEKGVHVPSTLTYCEIMAVLEDKTNEICTRLGISVYKQQPNESFTPLGDEEGLLILPVEGRIWMPDSGVPARKLPVKVSGKTNGRSWEVRGVPYEIAG